MPIVALSAGQFGPQLACAQGPQAAPAPALPVGHVLTSTSAPSVLVTLSPAQDSSLPPPNPIMTTKLKSCPARSPLPSPGVHFQLYSVSNPPVQSIFASLYFLSFLPSFLRSLLPPSLLLPSFLPSFFFFLVLGFKLRAYMLSHSTSPFLWWAFSRWGLFKPWSSLPPE
jgi:hypothetical protein